MFKRARGANGSRPDLVKRLRSPEFGSDPAEFELEYLRLPHRHGSPLLLPGRIGKLDEIVQCAIGDAHVDSAVQ